MKQIQQLQEGVMHYALLDASIQDLESRGLKFIQPVQDGTWDEAGPIAESLIELDSGMRLMLVAHLGVPEMGIEVRAPEFVRGPGVAREVAHELGLDGDRIKWVKD